jgi:hypothetical protein
MLKSIRGVYREGKIELLEPAPEEGAVPVIVTVLSKPSAVDLAERGIDPEHAADLRARLRPFVEDWDRPEMDVYDAI